MKLIAVVLGMLTLLSACVTREVQKETVVEQRPREVQVVPGPQGPPGPPGDTTIIVPR